MSAAEGTARFDGTTLAASAAITDTHVAAIAQRCLQAAVASGDRAFEYFHYEDSSTIEVRVWPDGAYKITQTTPSGVPLADPLPELHPRVEE